MKGTIKLLSLILGFIFMGFYMVLGGDMKRESTILWSEQPCTSKNVYFYLKELNIKNIKVVFAQAMLESDELRSDLAVKSNNLFGMRIPQKRPTTAVGKRKGYAQFTNWTASIDDYKIYQDSAFRTDMTDYQYITRLKKYATDPDYVLKLQKFTRKYDTSIVRYEIEYRTQYGHELATK